MKTLDYMFVGTMLLCIIISTIGFVVTQNQEVGLPIIACLTALGMYGIARGGK